MTVQRARPIALVAVLVITRALVPGAHLQAQEWLDEVRSLLTERGDAEVQYDLGVMYTNGLGVPQDDAEAVRWYRLAADQGLPGAQHNLGVMYVNGQGVSQDYVEAHVWFSLAAAHASGDHREGSATRRDAIAGLMTAEQIAEAQRRAHERMPTDEP